MAVPWSELITGVVGLAGIGGTLWQGQRTREADSNRDWIAEKRRVYARFQTSCQTMFRAMGGSSGETVLSIDLREAPSRIDDASLDMNLAFQELC
jgi:hypothetical protein